MTDSLARLVRSHVLLYCRDAPAKPPNPKSEGDMEQPRTIGGRQDFEETAVIRNRITLCANKSLSMILLCTKPNKQVNKQTKAVQQYSHPSLLILTRFSLHLACNHWVGWNLSTSDDKNTHTHTPGAITTTCSPCAGREPLGRTDLCSLQRPEVSR